MKRPRLGYLDNFPRPVRESRFNHRIHELRGVAVVGVVIHHVHPELLPGGFAGVDVFFVISGYLITAWLIERLHLRPQKLLSAFWQSRIRRLFPALAAMIAGIYLLAVFFLQPIELRFLGKHGFAGLIGAANVTLWTESGYFDADANRKPFLHLWSLGVEEQFYFFWPLALLLAVAIAGKLQLNTFATIRFLATAMLLISFLLALELSVSSPATAFFLPFARAWELLSGCLLAILSRNMGLTRAPFCGRGLIVVGLAGIVASFIFIQPTMPVPGLVMVFPVFSTCALILGSILDSDLTRRKVAWLTPMSFLGDISYALYLWHWPLLVMGSLVLGPLNLWFTEVVAVGTALLLATASTYLLENRFRRKSAKGVV